MYYRILGGTGLLCSVLSYGLLGHLWRQPGLRIKTGSKQRSCLTVAREGGINLFDNAEAYGVPMVKQNA